MAEGQATETATQDPGIFEDMAGEMDLAPDAGADVMIGLVAVMLCAVMALVPLLNLAGDGHLSQLMITEALGRETEAMVGDHAARVFVASEQGVSLPEEGMFVLLDALLDDRRLPSEVERTLNSGERPLLLITERGQEAAFLLEGIFSRAGGGQLSRVFLDSSCGYLKAGADREACAQGRYPAPDILPGATGGAGD